MIDQVKVDNKYTIRFGTGEDGKYVFEALRYDEEWIPNLTMADGSNMILAMANELLELRNAIAEKAGSKPTDREELAKKNEGNRMLREMWLESTKYNIPFCCGIGRELFNRFRKIELHEREKGNYLLTAIPFEYVGIVERHEDTYVHFCKSEEDAEKIMKDGKLRTKMSSDVCNLGQAVYTYPLGAGRMIENQWAIVFDTKGQHTHVVDAVDSNHCIGESVFHEDVTMWSPIIYSPEVIKDFIKRRFDWKKASDAYYGMTYVENVTMEDLPHYVNKILGFKEDAPQVTQPLGTF